MTTAYIAVLALVAYYFLAHDPYTNPFTERPDGSLLTMRFRPDPVDNLVLDRFAARRDPRTAEALSNVGKYLLCASMPASSQATHDTHLYNG